MTKCASLGRLFLFLLLAFFLAGCSQFKRSAAEDERDPHFIEGKRRVNGLDWDGAVTSFERALQSNPQNGAAHLELGIIYDQRKNDFGSAIYHYQRHLLIRTNSPMADVVNQNIIACKRELAKTVSYAIVTREVQRDLERLAQTNSMLQQRVSELERELARGPRYVTNYVTNFVAVPQFEPKQSSRLTQPTLPVDAPQAETGEAEREVASALQKQSVHETPPTTRAVAPPRSSTRAGNTTAGSRSVGSTPSAASTSVKPRTVHTVRPGETLAALASRYRVSVKEMRAANPGAARGVRAGQKINVPAKN